MRAITVEAYRAGARYVDVVYSDPGVRRALVDHAPEDSLGWTPPWMIERLERATREGGALLAIAGASHAALFEGADPARQSQARAREFDWGTKVYTEMLTAKQLREALGLK